MRSFIAIELDKTVKSALADLQKKLKKNMAGIKWVNPENIHLTLKFLGDIKEESTEQITTTMEKISSHYNSFNVEIKGLGLFPNMRSPRVLWAGINNTDILEPFQNEIDHGMEPIGFKRESRKFSPHLTLGRFKVLSGKKEIQQAVQHHENDSFGVVHVRSLLLMKSELHPEGAKHTKIREISLKITEN